ncbi:MAG TPA: tRNA adenosine(34) deaminase TadA [Candidatus Methylacidiphilales bacterium]|nr:tRNA adenosine(34) deaminase TadA [Candidatus Methylacidiphilales bacterium]
MTSQHPNEPVHSDKDLACMDAALDLAKAAAAAGEVPVGAIVINEGGVIIGSASNSSVSRKDATAHAEVLALQQAQREFGDFRLTGCTLYVTKEPCPMCAGAAILTRISRIVFGLGDPKAGALGGAFNVMDLPGVNHRCEIVRAVREAETHAVLREFFSSRRQESAQKRKAATIVAVPSLGAERDEERQPGGGASVRTESDPTP